MPAPNLTPAQKRVLDLALGHWAKQGAWPDRVQVMAWLRAEGLEYKAALSDKLWPLARTRDRGLVELTVFGAAAAEGGEAWVSYFVPLVQRGVEFFLHDPRGKPQLTDADLREVAQGEPKEQLRRLGELYYDALLSLGGGATCAADGSWQVHLTPNTLKYRTVKTVWDFLDRKQAVNHRCQELGPEHRRMALWIYETWRQTGKGPTPIDIILNHLDLTDPVATWEELPDGLFTEESLHSDQPRSVEPRLPGLFALQPETDSDLRAFVAILCAIRDLYLESCATKPPSLNEVGSRANAPPGQVVRLLELTPSISSHVGVFLQKRDGDVQITVDEAIFEIDKVKTLDDFLAWNSVKEQQRRQWTNDARSPPFPEAVSLALSGQQLALHRSLAARDEGLASMYHGALLVLCDDKNPDRFALAAHGMRELMEKLPSHFDVAMRAHGETLTAKIREVEDAWKSAVASSCCSTPANGWQGEIDSSLRKLLTKLNEFFSWLRDHIPRRRDEVSATLRTIDPANRELPSQLEKLNIDAWDAMREFFQSVSHHGKKCSREEFDQWSDAFERFLLERLVPRTFDDFADLDALIGVDGAMKNG